MRKEALRRKVGASEPLAVGGFKVCQTISQLRQVTLHLSLPMGLGQGQLKERHVKSCAHELWEEVGGLFREWAADQLGCGCFISDVKPSIKK